MAAALASETSCSLPVPPPMTTTLRRGLSGSGLTSAPFAVPNATVLALEEHGAIAGTASSLIGTLQFGLGSVVMASTGTFANGAPLPMIAGITVCALLCASFAHVTLRHRPQRVIAAA